MPDRLQQLRAALATGGSAYHALDLALAAARDAGVRAIEASRRLSVEQQVAVALQAADEAIEALALELADGTGS